jgi:hypothetical protein
LCSASHPRDAAHPYSAAKLELEIGSDERRFEIEIKC